jgi:hypothetical protein
MSLFHYYKQKGEIHYEKKFAVFIAFYLVFFIQGQSQNIEAAWINTDYWIETLLKSLKKG